MKRALIGNGGHAKEVMSQMGQIMARFVDDEYYRESDDSYVMPISKFDPKEYEIMIAIGDPIVRKNMVKLLPKETKYFTYIHPTAILMDRCFLGTGSFIGANCILTCDIEIGNHSILNRGVQIGHDCKAMNFFTAMPGSILSGDVSVGECVYIGTNSSVREKTEISNMITIGMGSCVIKSIIESGTYVGVPAKKIK